MTYEVPIHTIFLAWHNFTKLFPTNNNFWRFLRDFPHFNPESDAYIFKEEISLLRVELLLSPYRHALLIAHLVSVEARSEDEAKYHNELLNMLKKTSAPEMTS